MGDHDTPIGHHCSGDAAPAQSSGEEHIVPEELTNEALIERYAAAAAANNLDELARLRHPQWSVEWPQSGERVHSSESFAAIVDAYPGGKPQVEVKRIVGAEDRWVVSASNTVMRIAGSGAFWWSEWSMTYPDGQEYRVIDLFELREGRVFRETVYWAPPFAAPDWRRPFVEVADPAENGESASPATPS
jgi:hypothetical protein